MNVYRFAQFSIIALLLAVGCGKSVDPRVAALQKQFVVQNASAGEKTVSSIRKVLDPDVGAEAVTELDVVIRGRINAGEFPPWETGKTAFMLTDATGDSGDGKHDPHTCKFCSRNINDYLVQVSFRDEAGNLFEVDSREAFNLKEKQLLLIAGRATLDGKDDILQVDATSLHFAKPRPASTSAEHPSEHSVTQIDESVSPD